MLIQFLMYKCSLSSISIHFVFKKKKIYGNVNNILKLKKYLAVFNLFMNTFYSGYLLQ